MDVLKRYLQYVPAMTAKRQGEMIAKLAGILGKIRQPAWSEYKVIFFLRKDDTVEQMKRDCSEAIELRARQRRNEAELLAIPFMEELAEPYIHLPNILRTLGFTVVMSPKDSLSGIGWDANWVANAIQREWKRLAAETQKSEPKKLLCIVGGNIGHGKSYLLRKLKQILTRRSSCPEPMIFLEPEERWIPILTMRGNKNPMQDQEGLYTELVQVEVATAEREVMHFLEQEKPQLVIKERCMLECALTFIPVAMAQNRLMNDFLQRLTLWPVPRIEPPRYKLTRISKKNSQFAMEIAKQNINNRYAEKTRNKPIRTYRAIST